MKKSLIFILSLVMVFTLTACGGSSTDTTSTTSKDATATQAPTATVTQAPTADTTTTELTTEQQELFDNYNTMVNRYNEVADKFNADENLLTLTEVIDTTNQVATSIEDMSTKISDTASLSNDEVTAYSDLIVQSNSFIDELEALVNNYSGQTTVTIPITVQNNTGADLYTLSMSPANDNSWGGNLLNEALLNDTSGSSSMTITADTMVWDLMAADSEGTPVEFYGLDFSNVDVEKGATLVLYYDEETQAYTAGFDISEN